MKKPAPVVSTCLLSALLGTIGLAIPDRASAFDPWGPPGYEWPGGVYNYRINVGSFMNNLGPLGLSSFEVQYWIPYALNVWRERSGVDSSLTLNFVTTTTTTNNTCTNHDGFNQIYVVPTCIGGGSPPCDPIAETVAWPTPPSSPGPIVEADTCVYGPAAGPISDCEGGWRVRMDDLAPDRRDLIGILVHEFGHTFGLHHENGTVMQSGSWGCASTRSRYPTGDDIDGIRSLYGFAAGGIPETFWKSKVGNGAWTTEINVPSLDGVWPVQASVGRGGTGSTSKVVVTELSDAGDVIAFNRATYPIAANSTWTATNVSIDSWVAPAVSGRPNGYSSSELWVGAVAKNNQFHIDCNKIRIFRSTDAFATHTSADLGSSLTFGCGTMHEPALTFSSLRGRFVLMYVRRESSGSQVNQALQGKIFATTSTDGITWTTPNDLGIWTNDAVDAVCATSLTNTCMMTYVRSSINRPNLVNRLFTVDASGNVATGSWTELTVMQEQTPAAGSYLPDTLQDYLIGSSIAADESDRGNNVYSQHVATDDAVPFSPFSSVVVADSSRRSDFASLVDSNRIYLWYVR